MNIQICYYVDYKIICNFGVETERSNMLIRIKSGFVYADTDSAKVISEVKQQLNKEFGTKVSESQIRGGYVYANSESLTPMQLIQRRMNNISVKVCDFEPYLKRVYDESCALFANICKLQHYLDTKTEPENPEFGHLEMKEEAFQRQQLVHMHGYLEMLLCRMEMWCK